MFDSRSADRVEPIAFVLMPSFSMIAFASAVDCLRLANRMAGKRLYQWRLLSLDGGPVQASSGVSVMVDAGIDLENDNETVVVLCAGLRAPNFEDQTLHAWLRRAARRGAEVGALCTGAEVLAAAGLLDGYRCTLHWENIGAFKERYPAIDVSAELFEVDRRRFTCAGGTAAVDLILHAIAHQHGPELAAQISEQFILDRIRDPEDPQRIPLRARLGVTHPKLVEVISHMETNQEEPLRRDELASRVGLSRRQLERLFRRYLDTTPGHYYLSLRLTRARLLLLQTTMPVIDVALACGFVSASHFSKCYRDQFQRTPREERRRAQSARQLGRFDPGWEIEQAMSDDAESQVAAC